MAAALICDAVRALGERGGGLDALRLTGKRGEQHRGVVSQSADAQHVKTSQSGTSLVLIQAQTKPHRRAQGHGGAREFRDRDLLSFAPFF